MSRRRLILVASGAALAGIIYLVGWSSLLTISTVQIETKDPKNIALIEAQLREFGQEIRVGQPLARINVRAVERTLKQETWIGMVNLRRDWLSGSVTLTVEERIPLFRVERFGRESATYSKSFMTADGVLFQLPGDLANDYQNLPVLDLQSDDEQDRLGAVELFQAVDPVLPVALMRVTSISTYITENYIRPDLGRKATGNKASGKRIRIAWGEVEEIPTKVLVAQSLIDLKSNKDAVRIDVTNPELPTVSDR